MLTPRSLAAVKSDSPHASGRMDLREDHLLVGAVPGAPVAHAAFQRAAHPRRQFGVPAQQFLEDRYRAQLRRTLQQRDYFFLEDAGQRVGPAPPADGPFRGRQPRIGFDAVAAGGAQPGLGGGHRRLCFGTRPMGRKSAGDGAPL